MEEASGRRNQGEGIRERASGRRHREEASLGMHPGGSIMEEHLGCIWETSGRHQGSIHLRFSPLV